MERDVAGGCGEIPVIVTAAVALTCLAALIAGWAFRPFRALAAGWALGGVKWRYYPTARGVLTPYSASVLLAYFLLCLTPVLLQGKEARTWSSIASKT